jgi:hypothetical protein
MRASVIGVSRGLVERRLSHDVDAARAEGGEADMVEFRTDTAHQFIGKELYVSGLADHRSEAWSRASRRQHSIPTGCTWTWHGRGVEPVRRHDRPGLLMLSLVIYFGHMGGTQPKDTAYALNYGLDRVGSWRRVRTGSRAQSRGAHRLPRARPDRYLQKTTHARGLGARQAGHGRRLAGALVPRADVVMSRHSSR